MRTRALPALALLSLGSLALAGCAGAQAAAQDAPLTFATTPLGDDPTAQNPVDAMADLLAEETGLEVDVTDVPDYLAVVEAIRAGHVDFGVMSGFPSALAVNTGEVDALIAWPGADEPVAQCIVLDQSPITSVDDITPETVVAFADPASSSGYFMPVYTLDQAGLEKDEDYTALFSGGHDMSMIALQEGQADVACTATLITQMYGSAMFPFAEGETRSIIASDSMALSMAVLVPSSMPEERRQILLEAIPRVYAEENAEALGALYEGVTGTEPILEPDDELFQSFVDIAEVAGVDISDLG